MDESELKHILEALLMSSAEPLSLEQLQTAFEPWQQPTRDQIKNALKELSSEYESRSIELKLLTQGYAIQTRQRFNAWIARLLIEKPPKYSRALLETLAIIAYKQPVTRADIEDIRGVAVSTPIFKTLLEREWIKAAGYRDVPGKPAVYVTTKAFLDYFNLNNLADLPALTMISEMNE